MFEPFLGIRMVRGQTLAVVASTIQLVDQKTHTYILELPCRRLLDLVAAKEKVAAGETRVVQAPAQHRQAKRVATPNRIAIQESSRIKNRMGDEWSQGVVRIRQCLKRSIGVRQIGFGEAGHEFVELGGRVGRIGAGPLWCLGE